MPIRLRLALLFAAGTVAVAAMGGVVFVSELSSGLRNSVLTSLQARAGAISQQFPDAGTGGGAGLQVPAPGLAPGRPGSVDAEDLTQIIDSRGVVIDAAGPGTSSPLLDAAQLALARRQTVVIEVTIAHQPDPFLVLATPGDQSSSIVVVGASLGTVSNAVERVIVEIVGGGLVAVVIAGVAAWFLAGAALHPVERMRRQAAEISEHDSDAALAVPASRDEIAALARTLNELLRRLNGALSRQRGFVSAAGHELRSPLAILKGELELAGRPGRTQAELAQAVGLAADETDRIIRLADDLLLLSSGDEHALNLQRAPADLRALIERSVDSFETRAAQGDVSIEITGPTGVVADVDALRYRQIVDNLLDNALRYAPRQSTVTVSLEHSDGDAMLSVADEGPGFPKAFLPRAFERFSRPDDSRTPNSGGTGLGLAIVQSVAEAHGGSARAENRGRGGAMVSVTVPAGSAAGDPAGLSGLRGRNGLGVGSIGSKTARRQPP